MSRKELLRLVAAVLAAIIATLGVSETTEDKPTVQVNCPPTERVGVTVDAGKP